MASQARPCFNRRVGHLFSLDVLFSTTDVPDLRIISNAPPEHSHHSGNSQKIHGSPRWSRSKLMGRVLLPDVGRDPLWTCSRRQTALYHPHSCTYVRRYRGRVAWHTLRTIGLFRY